jgi:hypothetical protein
MAKEPAEPIVLSADDVVAAPPALIRPASNHCQPRSRPRAQPASERFIEFFSANIRNRNTDGLCAGRASVLRLVRGTRPASGRYQTENRGRLH